MDNTGSGFTGSYSTVSALTSEFLAKFPSSSTKRLLASGTTSVSSPAMCATVNETVAFGVSSSHYPVYLKDSLVNTVKNFDYGPFVTLADKLTKAGLNITVFLYKFSTLGTFIFGDSADQSVQTLIKVMNNCSDAYIVPMTSEELAALGIFMRDDVIKALSIWYFMVAVIIVGVILLGVFAFIQWRLQWALSWTYGKDLVTVMDKKKAGEPDEEEDDELMKLVKKGEKSVDGLFFVYLKQKLSEMDEKMRELLAKANINSVKKLKKLADKINRLKEIFNEHVGSLIMPNGMTIDEFLKANIDQLDHDSSYYSSVIDSSDDKSGRSTPKEKSAEEAKAEDSGEKPEEEKKEAEVFVAENAPYKVENEVEKDIKREAEKVKDDENVIKDSVKSEMQKRKDEYMNMVMKQGAVGNANDVQEYVKDELQKLTELHDKLNEEIENQNSGLQDRLMKRQEKKLVALAEIERLRKEQEETDRARRNEMEKLGEEQKAEIEAVDKETNDERDRGKQIIDKTLSEQLAEHHARFVQQFAESSDKEKLLARHEGETQRLKEYLESEKRRQEHELEIKLEQRTQGKKKEILTAYEKRKEGLNQKYQKLTEENEAKRAIIEGEIPATEERLIPYAEQLEGERKKVEKQLQKDAQSEDIVLDAKRRSETDAIEKKYQLEERKIYLDNRQEVDDLLKKEMDQEKALKEKFTKEIKTAPTSKEKNELLAQYEKSKNDLKLELESERKLMEEKTEERLAERRRLREKERIQLDGKLEQEKFDSDKKTGEKVYSEIERHSEEAIEQIINQAVAQNHAPPMDIPVIFEYLTRTKLQQNFAALKKAQFAELSHQLSAMQTQLMKEKFVEVGAIREDTEKRVKDLEKKSLAPDKYQKKLEHIQKNEVLKLEAVNANYENKSIGQESRIKTGLANQHFNEQVKLVDSEEASRARLLDRVLRRFNANGDIPKNVVEELNAKKAAEFNEMREEAKADKDKKLTEAQKVLGDMNQEELKEMEQKYAQEIDTEAVSLPLFILACRKSSTSVSRRRRRRPLTTGRRCTRNVWQRFRRFRSNSASSSSRSISASLRSSNRPWPTPAMPSSRNSRRS